MEDARQDPVSVIERALVTMRRDQQARRLQRGIGPRGHAPGRGPDRSLGGAARFRMLDALEAGPRTVSEVAAATGVDQPRASRLVADAAERGLVRRSTDPQDARRAVVELTPAGRAFLHSAHASRRDAVETALAGFSSAEREEFALLLDRFVAGWPRQNDSSDG